MRKLARKRKLATRFEQPPVKTIHKTTRRYSTLGKRTQPQSALYQVQRESNKEPSAIHLPVSEKSERESHSASQAKKRPGR